MVMDSLTLSTFIKIDFKHFYQNPVEFNNN